ncbi:hypothetical protein [Streptomyces sp. NPDC018045]|uniref:hypothetical protein n=1 Tax=Streptomyces sp. NPDC018045 TaxID=3365037 RepID=UPI00379CF1A6
MSSDKERAERVLELLLALIDASETLTASEPEELNYRGGGGLRVVFDAQPVGGRGGRAGGPEVSVRLDREERPRRERRPRALDGRRGGGRRALEGPP